jgi:putative FmdB family regulatory protein
MATYSYRCPQHGVVDIDHPMSAVNAPHACPECGETMRRKLTPIHHRWPSNHRPGNEHSGQRMFLDPEFRARTADEFAAEKEAHVKRTAHEKAVSDGT